MAIECRKMFPVGPFFSFFFWGCLCLFFLLNQAWQAKIPFCSSSYSILKVVLHKTQCGILQNIQLDQILREINLCYFGTLTTICKYKYLILCKTWVVIAERILDCHNVVNTATQWINSISLLPLKFPEISILANL